MSEGSVETLQCADVRTPGTAHSHITQRNRTLERTSSAQTSLKSLAGAVLGRTSSGHCTEATELTRLVLACGNAYGFTETEHAEAKAAALGDPDAGLLCYRTIADELGYTSTVTHQAALKRQKPN